MPDNKFPLLEKIKDSAGYIVVVVGALYIVKLVFGLTFNGGIGLNF